MVILAKTIERVSIGVHIAIYQLSMQLILVLLLILSCVMDSYLVAGCVQKSSCSCESDDGLIDLSPIASHDPTLPRFSQIPDPEQPGKVYFYWNPCFNFQEGSGKITKCINVAACYWNEDYIPAKYIALGNQSSAKFITDKGKLALEYTFSGDGKTYVYLTCRKDLADPGTITAHRIDNTRFEFYYEGRHACVVSDGISAGSVILIIFFTVTLLYFAVGMAVQIFARKATGREIVPQSSFWFALPGLVKDGVVFLIQKLRGKPTYNKL